MMSITTNLHKTDAGVNLQAQRFGRRDHFAQVQFHRLCHKHHSQDHLVFKC